MAASSVTTLFLLTGVCATLFAMGTVPLRDSDTMRAMKWGSATVWGPVLLLTLAGLLTGYIRFHRGRYIAWGGGLGLVLGILLAPIPFTPDERRTELIVASLVGIVGLLAFQVFIRLSHRKK